MKVKLPLFIILFLSFFALQAKAAGEDDTLDPKEKGGSTPVALLDGLRSPGAADAASARSEFSTWNPMKGGLKRGTSGPIVVSNFSDSEEIAYVLEGEGLSPARKVTLESLSPEQQEVFNKWASNMMLYHAWDEPGVIRQGVSAVVGIGAGWCAKSGTWSSWAFSMYPRMGVEPVIEDMQKQGFSQKIIGWGLYGYAQATLNPIYMAQMCRHFRDDVARAFVYLQREIPHKKENCGVRRFFRFAALSVAALDSLPELYIYAKNTLQSPRSWIAYPFFLWQNILERDLLLRDTARKVANTFFPEPESLATKRAKLISCIEGFGQAVRDPSMTGERLKLIHQAFMTPGFNHPIFIGMQASRWPIGIQTVGADKEIDARFHVAEHSADKLIRLLEMGFERRKAHGYPKPKEEDTARFAIRKAAGLTATGAFWAAGSAIYSTLAPVMGNDAALVLTVGLTGPRIFRGVKNFEQWVASLYDAWTEDSHYKTTVEYNPDTYINIQSTRFGQRFFLGIQGAFMSAPIIAGGAIQAMEVQGLDPAAIALATIPFAVGEGAFVANQAIKELNEAVTLAQHISYFKGTRKELLLQRRLLRFADDALEEVKEADERVVETLTALAGLDDADILPPATPTMAQRVWGYAGWAGQGLWNAGGALTKCLGCGSRRRVAAVVGENPMASSIASRTGGSPASATKASDWV